MTTHTKLTEIQERMYEGYIWYSNQEEPKILNDEAFHFTENHMNPFVIEALLYNKSDRISVMVRHTGKYTIHETSINNLPEGSILEEKSFLTHRLTNITKAYFKQLWIPEKDIYCSNMEVLKLKAIIFTGFKI